MTTPFALEDLKSLIEQHERRFEPLHKKIEWRHRHFHNDVGVNPPLAQPYAHVSFQSDAPRRLHSQLKARLTENHWVTRVNIPKETARLREAKDDLESVFDTGLRLVEDRQGLDIQGALADGQIISCFGVLHWSLADHIWPEVPEYEWRDDLPEDGEERSRYVPAENKYRESDASLQKRRARDVARAGFPWLVEVLPPQAVMFTLDRSLANGIGLMVVKREVGLLDYLSKRPKKDEKPVISLRQLDGEPLDREQDAPPEWAPSREVWGEVVTVYQVWTRKHFYELVCGANAGPWEIVEEGAHGYEMPPFALAPAVEVNESDPAWRYEPLLEGVFRVKASFDRTMSLTQALSESHALPWWYLEKVDKNAPPLTDEEGKVVTFTQNATLAEKVPDGYKVSRLDTEINPAFIAFQEFMREELKDASPDAGQAEVTASTQPWAIRLQQAQAAIVPGRALKMAARAINIMERNMALVMSKPSEDGGIGETVWTFKRLKDGAVDQTTLIGVEPKDIATLDISVEISGTSEAEQITKAEHGVSLWQRKAISRRDLNEHYLMKERPVEYQREMDAEQIFDESIKPGLIKQRLAKALGGMYVLAPDGAIVGIGGEQVAPAQVLQQNGVQPIPAPAAGGGAPPQVRGNVQMPQMGQFQVPGTMPIQGPV